MIASLGAGQKGPSLTEDPWSERLVGDLISVLSCLCRWRSDFYRSRCACKVGALGSKVPLPESVLSAVLGVGLEQSGWSAEREALSGQGRADLKLTAEGGTALVEAKIWGRNNWRESQEQIERLWAPGVTWAAVVMFLMGGSCGTAGEYWARCLCRPGRSVQPAQARPPLLGRFHVESVTRAGAHVSVEHLLVSLPWSERAPRPDDVFSSRAC